MTSPTRDYRIAPDGRDMHDNHLFIIVDPDGWAVEINKGYTTYEAAKWRLYEMVMDDEWAEKEAERGVMGDPALDPDYDLDMEYRDGLNNEPPKQVGQS